MPDKRLTARLELRLSPEELKRWREAAERCSRPLSNMVRIAVEAWVRAAKPGKEKKL